VLWWASLGAAFVALQAYVFLTWFTSGDAAHTSTGADELSTATKVWVVGFQVLSISLAVAIVVYVVRQSLRERRLSFDAMLVIAWVSMYWQDPLLNYVRQQFFYNSYLLNLGAWTERIPGWISPNGSLLPEPLAFVGMTYFWLGPGASLLTFFVMRRAKHRRPQLGVAGLLLVGWLTMVALDLLAEVIFIRTELYAYSGSIHGLSIWGGERWQFPIYEAVLWPMVWTAMGALRYFRDDKGRTILDRGLDRVRAVRWHTALRVLAIVGFANAAMLIYNVGINGFGLHAGATPDGYPSYMRNGMCGEGTDYACTAPWVPIPLPDSGPLPPDEFGN
jgi:hypothetical protein